MDFQLLETPHFLAEKQHKGWFFMDGEDCFRWPQAVVNQEEDKASRKRKSPDAIAHGLDRTKSPKNSPVLNINKQSNDKDNNPKNNGASRIPHWQVDDITDLHADIGSLNDLAGDLSNNSYNMSDAIMNISSLTVFKQEAPSPTHDVNNHISRQQQQQMMHSPNNDINNQNNNIHNTNQMINNTIHQLLGQNGFSNMSNSVEGGLLSPSSLSGENYGLVSSNTTNSSYPEDSRFQYVLAAATSIATKINEDTLTYLNQGQSYEIKLKKLGDLSTYRGKMFKSIIRICFHERRLQYMEKEQIMSWQKSRPGDRILEIDVPLSYGLFDVVQPKNALNTVYFTWDPTKEVGAYIKVNCISTEFTPKKHGGEKGVPFRIQVETYQVGDGLDLKRLHAAVCQIKVFKLKGADRKHKQDREKILKRPITEQEKYQPSYECTVLSDIPNDAIVSSPMGTCYPQECSSPQLPQQLPQLTDEVPNLHNSPPPQNGMLQEQKIEVHNNFKSEVLSVNASPEETAAWLSQNRFERYLQTFNSFRGVDMLRLSRDDLEKICGQVDGIRLYNALQSKALVTIYVRREDSMVYNAIFLSSFNSTKLLQELSILLDISPNQVRAVYIEGPQSIHIQLDEAMMRHIKEEAMYIVKVLEDGGYLLVLKQTDK